MRFRCLWHILIYISTQRQILRLRSELLLEPSHNGRDARKPVFGVYNVRFKSACSATETSSKMEISLVASL